MGDTRVEYKTRIGAEDVGIERKCAGNGTCPTSGYQRDNQDLLQDLVGPHTLRERLTQRQIVDLLGTRLQGLLLITNSLGCASSTR